MADKKVKLVIDSSSKSVLDTLPYHPYLLKPNDQELASFFDLNEKLDQEKIIKLARKLIDERRKVDSEITLLLS